MFGWTQIKRKDQHKPLIIIIRIYKFVDRRGQVELADIVGAIQAGRVRITDHAYEEANTDMLKFDEIYFRFYTER